MPDKIGKSRLGFGCAHLPGQLTRAEAERLIGTALQSGIRHFDAARMYGDGQAEGILGAALRGRRDEVALVTKAGIFPASRSPAARPWRKAARQLPGLAKLAPAALRAWAEPRFGQFSAAAVRASVETSLRELRTEYVDALLLHECAPSHVTDELKHALAALLAEGKILRFGIASTWASTQAVAGAHPDVCGIVQVEADGSAIARPPGAQLIVHSVLGARFRAFVKGLECDQARARHFLEHVGITPTDRSAIAALFLQEAQIRHPEAVILFSSTQAEHIRRNAGSAPHAECVQAFQDFLASEALAEPPIAEAQPT